MRGWIYGEDIEALFGRGSWAGRSRAARSADALCPEIERVWHYNLRVYGARKGWHRPCREGIDVADNTLAETIIGL